MTEQKVKKSGIAKKLRKGILSPCYKSTKVKENVSDKHDLDNIDNGTLSFDSKKYLKKKNSDVNSINTNVSRPSNVKTESPLTSEITETESYLKRKPQNKGKEKVEVTEIVDVNSSDSEDDVPLSQITKVKQNIANTTTTSLQVPPKANRQESVESKDSFYTANNVSTIQDEKIKMPVPTGSKYNDVTGSISIPSKMEPTKSGMASRIDAKIANQSIPMPVPTDSTYIDESESSIAGNETTYIIEEIVTEEIVNGKKRITTQTITRRANPQNSIKSPKSPVKNTKVGITQQPSYKMPVAVGSKMEKVNIPAKMTPSKTETTSSAEGIIEMPMALPKPSVSTIDTGVPNLVDAELNSTPLSEIEDEDRPNAIPMPSVPIVVPMTAEPTKAELTGQVVSSPKLMGEENPSVPVELALESRPTVEAGFNFSNVSQKPSVEAGFNFPNSGDETKYMSIPPESLDNTKPVDAGFNFKVTDEANKPLPMPVPGNYGNENIQLSNSPPVPNLLALSSANKKQEKQEGYLNIPLPLPPSAIEDNHVIEDDRSDVSHGSKKIMVSSPKILTADEEIQFTEKLADKERLEHEEALKNETPITNISMPKTPSTYFKNNNLSDNEGASDEVVKVGTPAALPSITHTIQPELGSQKMKITVVNQDESDSDSDDDEKLINIKRQYEQKKKELEARIGNLQGNIVDSNEDIKYEIKEEIPVAPVTKVTQEIRENIPVVPEAPVKTVVQEVKEEIPVVPVKTVVQEVKEEIPVVPVKTVVQEVKEEVPVVPVKTVVQEVKEEIPTTTTEVKEEIVEEIKNDNDKGKMEELKDQISTSIKKHQRTMSNGMSNLKKKVDESLEQTKEHLKETKDHIKENLNKPKSEKSKEELVTEVTTTTVEHHDNPITETEVIVNESTVPEYASSEASLDTFINSSKKSNRPKSIKSFFGFSKKDKKDKKEKKTVTKIEEETIPEFPDNNLSVSTSLKEKRGSIKRSSESHSPFSFKRFVSPFSSNKRRTSNASLKSKSSNKINDKSELSESSSSTIPDIQLKTEVVNKAPVQVTKTVTETVQEPKMVVNNLQQKPLPVPIVRPSPGNNMNKVIADVQAQAGQPPKFVIPEDALNRIEEERVVKKEVEDDKNSIRSVSTQSSTSSASSNSSASSASSASSSASSVSSASSSSSSSDEEVLGNLVNKKQNASAVVSNTTSSISHSAPIKIETSNHNQNQHRDVDLHKNYTSVDNDDFVSLMMVQRMLSSSVDRTSSLEVPTSPTSVTDMPSSMINPYSFVDVEAEKKKSFSKPKAIVTAVNPRNNDDPIGTPRSTILYKFDEKPTLESKNNFYRNDFASRSVGSLPIAVAKEEEVKSSPKQRMVELNLDNSMVIENKEIADADNRKSTLLDSNLMQMFDDIHNLSLDDIANRYTKPSMIQCDVGPSFLDEVMGSLSMDKH